MAQLDNVLTDFAALADPETAAGAIRFFKTAPGEYGEGDKFCGVKSSAIKKLVRKYAAQLSLADLQRLITDSCHEIRSFCLQVLIWKYEKSAPEQQREYVKFYLHNVKYINNWDLVDISAYKILGRFCWMQNEFSPLYALAESGHLWSERIAVVANWYIIRRGNFSVIRRLAVKFMDHPHDLMHKAVGWMLREMGKVERQALLDFLDVYAAKLPRTTLRYAIERLPQEIRRGYLEK